MKKILLITILLSICFTLFSYTKASSFEKEKIISTFLEYKNLNNKFQISDVEKIGNSRSSVASVYNLEPKGYIILSNNKDLYPVIAYSFTSNFKNSKDMFSLREFLKLDLQLRTEFYQKNKNAADENRHTWKNFKTILNRRTEFQQWPAPQSTQTDGWIETEWNQSGVLNNFCPLDNSGERSVVGCVATAMAQIIHYHEYVGQVSFNDSDSYASGYSWPYIWIDDDHEEHDFPSFEELNGYLDDLDSHYETEQNLTNDDLAALNFACGISVEMSYSSEGSGTSTTLVPSALLNKFGYDSAQWIENTGNSFYTSLAEEMKNMRPIEMSIYHADWSAGHAINADGYNTDDYFHLNFGWGTSDNTCWYTLPYGMPDNYSIISGAAVNVEAGETPFSLSGNVSCDLDLNDVHIYFSGEDYNFEAYTNSNGEYNIPAITEGFYVATATTNNRVYYDSVHVYVSETNNVVNFDMTNYEAFTGSVLGDLSDLSSNIILYQDGESVYTGSSDTSGNFSIPDVLPGEYRVVTNASGNYFSEDIITISADDQTEDIYLEEYAGNLSVGYHAYPTGIFDLGQSFETTAAIKLTEDELENQIGNAIAKVKFKSPISQSGGSIKIQIFENNKLVSEKNVTNYVSGEWQEYFFDNFVIIKPGNTYFVGYRITTDGPVAFHDNGPIMTGKGAFIKTVNTWVELTNPNFNFCIEPTIITQSFGTVHGSINTTNINQPEDIIITAGNYRNNLSSDNTFSIDLTPGTYEFYATSSAGNSDIIEIEIEENEILELDNITINETSFEENDSEQITTNLKTNFPNPFNLSIPNKNGKIETNISFSLAENSQTELSIYNLKGRKVKTLINKDYTKGSYSIPWNGKNKNNKRVSSGVYFYRLKTSSKIYTRKMLLLK